MNDIEKKIYQAGQVQRLSKTSDDVLEAYQLKHRRRVQKKFIFIPTFTALGTIAAATAFVFIFKPVSVHLEGQTKGFDDGSSVLTSLASDLSIHYYVQPANGVQSKILNAAMTQDEFNQVVTDVDAVYSAYSYYQTHTEGFNYAFDTTMFSYDDTTYRYQLSVNNTTVYLKDNISGIGTKGTFEGLIRIDDSCYPCEVVSRVNNNHVYTTFRYRINSRLYSLSHETQNQRTTISYEIREDEEVSEIHSVILKYNDNTFSASFTNEDKVLEVEKERNFVHKDQTDYVSVEFKKKTISKNIHYTNIKLTTSSGKRLSRTYTYDDLEPIVI